MCFVGVITNGGAKSNIIPEETTLDFSFRTPTTNELATLKKKVEACFQAAAVATGCEVNTTTMGNNIMCLLHKEAVNILPWGKFN